MFLPVFLLLLSDGKACPYTYLPHNATGPAPTKKGLNWDGHANSTTTCRVHEELPSKVGSRTINAASQIFGGPQYGLDYYPKESVTFHHPNLNIFFLEDEKYLSEAEISKLKCNGTAGDCMVCNPDTGDFKFGTVRNVSGWAAACEEGKDLGSLACDAGSTGSNHEPCQGYIDYAVEITNAGSLTEPYEVASVTSSNEEILANNAIIENEIDDSTGKTLLKLKIKPNLMSVGSTTVEVTLQTLTGTKKSGSFKFTLNTLKHKQCPYRVSFMGTSVKPVSYTYACLFLSVLLQIIVYFTCGAFGDYGPYRKRLFVFTAIVGSVSCMLIVLCATKDSYALAGFLTVISNGFFGVSILFYNAFLPYISRGHPDIIKAKEDHKDACAKGGLSKDDIASAEKKLLDNFLNTQDRISSKGFFWGYVSGGCMTIVSIGLVLFLPSKNYFGIRICIFLSGLWWLGFSIPAFLNLKPRPGPPFPADFNSGVFKKVTFSLRRIMASMHTAMQLPETARFILAAFFYMEACNAITSTFVIFSTEELGMTVLEITLLAAIGPLFGAFGVWLFRKIQVKKNLSSKTMLVRAVTIIECLTAYSLIGYLRDLEIWSGCPIGLVQKNEVMLCTIIFGSGMGNLYAYSRTVFVELIPPGQESEYFSVFEIADRGSGILTPILATLIYESTGKTRHIILMIFAICSIGLFLLRSVDVERGSKDCRSKEVAARLHEARAKFGIAQAQKAIEGNWQNKVVPA